MADAFPAPWRVLVVAVASLCLLRLPTARAQAAVGEALCRPPDQISGRMIEELRRLLSSADSAADEPVCELAIRALNTRARTPSQRRQVYIYHLGSQYAVEDPEQRASEYRMVRIFNLDWELSGDVLLY